MPLTLELALISVPDREIVAGLRAITPTLQGAQNINFQWRIFQNENFNVPIQEVDNNPTLRTILERGGEVLLNSTLVFQAPQGGGSLSIDRQPDGSLILRVNLPDAWNSQPDLKLNVGIAIRDCFNRYIRTKVLDNFAPQISEFYTRRESTLVQLEALNSRITIENDEHRRALEAHLEQERQRLEQSFQDRVATLEGDYRSKAEVLAKRESELGDRKQKLDDRDNTHARRQIQMDLKEVLKQSNVDFSLTQKTARKRWPSAVALFVLMGALAVASGWALWATTQTLANGEPFWYPVVRFAISLSAFGSSVVFYIRWQDRWSNAHAAEEFRLKRFDLDIARARWLVEVMLEWSKAQTELPKELIEKLATGLFEQSASDPLVKHPAEEILGALLSSSSSVNLKLPGGDVSLDRKGVRDLVQKTN